MPIKWDIPLSLSSDNILRRQGIRQRSSRPEITTTTEKLLSEIQELCLLEPAAAYNTCSVSKVSHDRIGLNNGMEIMGASLASFFSESRELAVVVCTIGPKLEKRVTDYLSGREPLRGLLLDGIGSAAVDSLAQEACNLIQNEASLRGYQAGSPFSPGTPGFPITEQWQLFRLVPAEEIGVRLTASGLMVPRKSISMIIALGKHVTIRKRGEACARCNLSQTCRYKLVVT
jgi:hypothetical protein